MGFKCPLWLELMNLVTLGFFWPQGRGAQLDMIFSVAIACTGYTLTTMAHLREPVNMCWDLDLNSKQSFHLMMNSRAGQGTEERSVALPLPPCFSLHSPAQQELADFISINFIFCLYIKGYCM